MSLAVGCLAAFMGLQAFCYAGFHAYVQVLPDLLFSHHARVEGLHAPPFCAISGVPFSGIEQPVELLGMFCTRILHACIISQYTISHGCSLKYHVIDN